MNSADATPVGPTRRLGWQRRLTGVTVLKSALQLATRAQEQFDALKAKTDAFLDEHPWGTEVRSDDEGWSLLVKISQQPPEDWWMDLGELADNMRASVNHLMRPLITDSGNNPDKGRPQFPIFEVEEDYLGEGGKNSNREKMLIGVAARHRKLIDNAQPYQIGERAAEHPLSILRSLTDRHKHRDQHVGAMVAESVTTMHTIAAPLISAIGMTVGRLEASEPLFDGQLLNRVLKTGRPEGEVETPPDLVERGWPPRMLVTPITGIDPSSHLDLTVAFFGDRVFKIDDIARVPPFVLDLVERFERRIEGRRPSSGTAG